MSEESMQIDYEVTVSGLEQTQAALQTAKRSADQAKAAIEETKKSGISFYPMVFNIMGAVNNVRQAVNQLLEGIQTMNPILLLSAFLNMLQVVNNLTVLTNTLKTSTAGAAAAQGILATLTGNWWLIPLALTVGALIYSRIQSMQVGGIVKETGPYLLHRGEYIIPEKQVLRTDRIIERSPASVNKFGPIYVTFNDQPAPGQQRDKWLDNLDDKLEKRMRRSG